MEALLKKMADTILHLDEASLTSLWEKYRKRSEQVDASPEWQQAMIVFFMINAVKTKNAIFNDYVLNMRDGGVLPHSEKAKPTLRLVKDERK